MGRNSKNKRKQEQRNHSGSPAVSGRHPHSERENEGSGSAAAPAPPSVPATDSPPAAAASLAMDCNICNDKYDEQRRKPRNLRCGHTFCSLCCEKLVSRQRIACPTCRKETAPVQDHYSLPVNYPLLGILNENATGTASVKKDKSSPWSKDQNATRTASMKKDKSFPGSEDMFSGRQKKKQPSPHGGKCLEARAEVAMHCAHCDLWLCKDCSRIDHMRPECVLVPYQDTLKEMGQAGKVKIRATQQTLEDFCYEVNAYSSKLSSCAAILQIAHDCILKEKSPLQSDLIQCKKLEEDLSDIATESVPSDVEDALCYLDNLETATQAAQQWATDASTSVLKVDQVFRLSKALLQTAVQMHTSTRNGSMMGHHRINGVDVTLPVDMDGSRLLVHAAQRNAPTTGCKLVKLEHIMSCIDPSCALTFLDISLRGRELGRVFIRLLGITKRSLCFLMMCTGEAGPSFRNTPFHRVCWTGRPGEHFWTGDYDCEDGGGGSLPRTIQDETKELSNEKTQVPVSAGLVAGRWGNSNSTIFRVYTRESPDAVEEFAFGRVEYGLQVFKDALMKHNNNITDLRISDCGMVVEP